MDGLHYRFKDASVGPLAQIATARKPAFDLSPHDRGAHQPDMKCCLAAGREFARTREAGRDFEREEEALSGPVVSRQSLFVVVAGLEDHKVRVEDQVNEPVLLGDAARPGATDAVLERLWFADPVGRIA